MPNYQVMYVDLWGSMKSLEKFSSKIILKIHESQKHLSMPNISKCNPSKSGRWLLLLLSILVNCCSEY